MTESQRQGIGWDVPWVVGVPGEWEVRRMRHALRLSTTRNDESRGDLLSLSVAKGVIPKDYDDESQVRPGDELRNYFLVQPGQFVVNPMWLMHGSLGTAAIPGVISPDYRVYDPAPGVEPGYVHHLLKTREYQELYALLARGTTTYDRRISKDAFNDLPLPLPPLPIQKAIAAFLDRKTTAIDALIEKKQKLLDLLAEKRAALINQAVTKGLDPNVPMKDSGIPWIGKVPAHWEVMALRLHAKVVDCKHRTPSYVDDGFPLVSTTEVKPGRIDLSVVTRMVDAADFREMTENRLPRPGDIIYSRNASLGAAAYVDTDEPFAMGQDVVLITSPQRDLLYLSYLLNSQLGMTQVDLACIGSTFKRINVAQIKQLQVCVPPSEEARCVAQYLDEHERRYSELRLRLVRHIARLQEYRQALITAAVTGQLDIGEEAV